MLCGIIPSGGNSPFSAVSRCCWTDLHSPGRPEARGVRDRDLLCVSADAPTPTHSPCSSQNCIQSSEVAEAKLVQSVCLLGKKEQNPPNDYRKGKRLCQLFFQEDGKLEGSPRSWVKKLTSNRKTAHSLENEIICNPNSSDLRSMEPEVCFCGSSSFLDLRSSSPQKSPSP